jgi:hypothetical protein
VLALAGLIGAVRAADLPTGTWKLTPTTGSRARDAILKLETEGDRVTGTVFQQLGPPSQLENVRYEDGRLSFRIYDRRQGIAIEYTATIGPDSFSGQTTFERRGERQTFDWVARRTFDTPMPNYQVEIPPIAADIDLNDGNYLIWRDHILPDPKEMAWEKIPWLTTFKDGILAADTADKPLLLWTMNGHPLGCT